MSPPAALGVKPAGVTAEGDFAPWFAAVAGHLLNATDLVINGNSYRFAELEAYYHGPGHADHFSHREAVQRENGRWYFHRTGGQYRGGSFKGLDLTFGDGTAHFGILIRTLVAPDGTVIDGPSLTVDHLLALTSAKDVAALDELVAGRKVWDTSSPLSIRESAAPRAAEVFRASRVGLSLKKAKGKPDALRFVGRPYRYLTEPRAITKGKPHLVFALHRRGEKPQAIHVITGVPLKTIERYIKEFETGQSVPNFDSYIGKDLSTSELCRMLGTWAAKFGGL